MATQRHTGRGQTDDEDVAPALGPAVDLLRFLTLGYAAYTLAARLPEVARPSLAWAILGALALWSALVAGRRWRGRVPLIAELALACAAILLTAWVDTSAVIQSGASTVPGLWPAATVVAWAVAYGVSGALVAGVSVAVADVIEAWPPTSGTVHNIVLIVLLAICVGYCTDLLRTSRRALREALAAQVASAERERLARVVHDGVLQSLSYIHRRGLEEDGAARDLGVLAGEQERALRTLLAAEARVSVPSATGSDLRVLLSELASPRVDVISAVEPLNVPPQRGAELVAAVRAALDNVATHAGPDAHAWVLLDADAEDVIVTVRDNGPGVTEERLAQAARDGRMGVSRSIQGRLADLGGVATYHSSQGAGTRVELRVPRQGRDL